MQVPDVAMATGMDKLDPGKDVTVGLAYLLMLCGIVAEVPFTVRDYTVQSPQHYSAPLYPPSGPMYYPMLGQQYNSMLPKATPLYFADHTLCMLVLKGSQVILLVTQAHIHVEFCKHHAMATNNS